MQRVIWKVTILAALAVASQQPPVNVFAESAAQTASRQARAACELPPSRKVEEYGEVSPAEEQARLDKFAAALGGEPEDVKGFVVAYAGRAARAGDALRRADAAKEFLIGKRVSYNARLNAIDCGRKERASVELWLTPVGGAPPVCAPTVTTPAPRPRPRN